MKQSIPFITLAIGLMIFFSLLIFQPTGFPFDLLSPASQCGVQNCNGLDISCGAEVAEVCPAIYQIGDMCRSLASCQVINGTCQAQISSEFTQCRSCVENCVEQSKRTSNFDVFSCEATCLE